MVLNSNAIIAPSDYFLGCSEYNARRPQLSVCESDYIARLSGWDPHTSTAPSVVCKWPRIDDEDLIGTFILYSHCMLMLGNEKIVVAVTVLAVTVKYIQYIYKIYIVYIGIQYI